ncbi:MAG: class I SAM-dependent methyltransferase [Candidatus Azobacteroides sp.]|nr:class I SAM-dependent methyltransferase [Candidatus Azobacteroides sp.]
MYEFHSDRNRYFLMQKMVCEEDIIPFIEKVYPFTGDAKVLEIGCGTAGVLSAFLERGHKGFGVDLDTGSLDYAREKLSGFIESEQLTLINNDIYSIDFEKEYQLKFDIIILKDVIEHIHGHEKLLKRMQSFLNPSGVIFIGFPPWQMPFGGHQQICRSKFLSHLPYFHLLPTPAYRSILKAFKEGPDHLCELQETGISIEQLEKLAKKTNYTIVNKELYFINPIYKHKFKMKGRKQSAFIGSIPYVRNFFTTCAFYLLKA